MDVTTYIAYKSARRAGLACRAEEEAKQTMEPLGHNAKRYDNKGKRFAVCRP